MKFFNLFRKNKNNNESYFSNELSSLEEKIKDEKYIRTNDLTSSSNFNININGERLKYVRYKDFNNRDEDVEFVVPKEVKTIDAFAFSEVKNLRKVIFHKNIRYIDQLAFQGCKKLQSIIGLEECETMKTFSGFSGCYDLEKITIPPNVEVIGKSALSECKKITKIKLPDSCWSISPYAFDRCESLEYIELPANIELISYNAFKGCKNLVIVFVESTDDKKYLEDYYQQEKYYENIYDFYSEEEDIENEEDNTLDEEAKEILYDDLNIKYKKINLFDKEMLWTIGKVIIQENSLSDVKEVVCFDNDIVQKVIKSGYKGKITVIDRENQIQYSIDLRLMEKVKKEEKQRKWEKYYNQFLIPNGGTANWMLNCELRNYRSSGYHKHVVSEIKISNDSRIEISDYTQPGNNGEEEFFTSITFYKKELDNHSIYAPHVYDRGYPIYYPYGARFNEELLRKIGYALSSLINNARDLNDTIENQEMLKNIANKQKQLIELFVNGTNDEMSVEKIVGNTQNIFIDGNIREAKIQKDWIPYHTELEKQKVLKKEKN